MVEGVLVVDEHRPAAARERAARRMLRVEREAVGRPYVEAIRHPGIVEHFGRVLGRRSGRRRSSCRSAATAPRDLVARLAPVVATGRGAVLVLHDITDLKRADQIRRDFVANVSHELRTPLTAIRGYAEALLDEPDDADGPPAVPRDHPAPRGAHGAAGEGSAAAGPARRRPGAAGARPRRRAGAWCAACVDDLAPADRRARTLVVVGRRRAARRAMRRRRRRQAPRHPPQPGRERRELHAGGRHGRRAGGACADRRADAAGRPTTGPAFRPTISAACSSASTASTSRAAGPAAPGSGLAIVKHLADLHGGTVSVANRAGRRRPLRRASAAGGANDPRG